MSTTLTMLKERLQDYVDAEKKVTGSSQSWSSPDGMTYSRANITDLRMEIRAIRQEIAVLEGGYGAQSFVFGGR